MPVTTWRAPSRWRARPATVLILAVGLWLFGTGEALLVVADVGVSPWTVLAQGVNVQAGVSIGTATLAISAVVLLLWIPLRQRPGLGTLSNAVLIAVAIDVMVRVLPSPDGGVGRSLEVLAGIATIGLGSGLYLTTGLGPGPRDGWMTGLHERLGLPVTMVRLGIELLVLVAGWLLGGTVGVGTVAFALLIGPSVGYGLRFAAVLGRAEGVVPTEDAPATEA